MKDIEPTTENVHEQFLRHITNTSTVASNNALSEGFDLDKETKMTEQALMAMKTKEGLEAMISAQMLSIHELQQKTMALANATKDHDFEKYYTNSSIKLANCFVQQANALLRLQGHSSQKIIVERVDVHNGGQAVVGNVQANQRGTNGK